MHFHDLPLQSSDLQLKTYTKETLSVLSQRGNKVEKLTITVVSGEGPSLHDRDCLKYLTLEWAQISMVQNSTQLEDLKKEYSDLF